MYLLFLTKVFVLGSKQAVFQKHGTKYTSRPHTQLNQNSTHQPIVMNINKKAAFRIVLAATLKTVFVREQKNS